MSKDPDKKPGYEYPDPTPMVASPKLRMPMHEVLRTRMLIQQQMSQIAAESGNETFEEADDFDLPEEEWISPYEQVFEPVVSEGNHPPIDSAEGKTPASTAGETPANAKPENEPVKE